MLLISSLLWLLQEPVLAVEDPSASPASVPTGADAPPAERQAARPGAPAGAPPSGADPVSPTQGARPSSVLPRCDQVSGETACLEPAAWRRQQRARRSSSRFNTLTSKIREARCATALCWWPDNFWGLEILAEAPLGSSFALQPHLLGGFLDNNGFTVQLTAGVRLWSLWDYVSVSVYFSKLAFQSNDAAIRIPGYAYEHPTSSIRRPYPGVAVGLLADILWIGFDYNLLYNGSGSNRDPHFRENSRLASAWTMSIAIAPINLGRSIGAAASKR